MIRDLLARGAVVRAYDPVAMAATQAFFPSITYCADPYEAAMGADAVALITDWNEFKEWISSGSGRRCVARCCSTGATSTTRTDCGARLHLLRRRRAISPRRPDVHPHDDAVRRRLGGGSLPRTLCNPPFGPAGSDSVRAWD